MTIFRCVELNKIHHSTDFTCFFACLFNLVCICTLHYVSIGQHWSTDMACSFRERNFFTLFMELALSRQPRLSFTITSSGNKCENVQYIIKYHFSSTLPPPPPQFPTSYTYLFVIEPRRRWKIIVMSLFRLIQFWRQRPSDMTSKYKYFVHIARNRAAFSRESYR